MDELKAASIYYGFDLSKHPKKRQKMFIAMHHYQEGWIDENKLEDKMKEIFKNKEKC